MNNGWWAVFITILAAVALPIILWLRAYTKDHNSRRRIYTALVLAKEVVLWARGAWPNLPWLERVKEAMKKFIHAMEQDGWHVEEEEAKMYVEAAHQEFEVEPEAERNAKLEEARQRAAVLEERMKK